jgi:hypothetical protein
MGKIHLLLSMLLTLIVSGSPAFSKVESYKGEKSTLLIDKSFYIPRHDSDEKGTTGFTLLSNNGTTLFKHTIKNDFCCLGYSPACHAFVLHTWGETGVSQVVNNFAYLSEGKPAIVYSKHFNYEASMKAIVPSSDLRFIAFVGRVIGADDRDWRLYVLDTKLDAVRSLGEAPHPPPFSKDDLKAAKADAPHDPTTFWGWGSFICTPKLESNICRFVSPNVLQVSYGEDNYMRRSKNRVIRKWTL